jgi:hypothetical protein
LVSAEGESSLSPKKIRPSELLVGVGEGYPPNG